MTTVQIGGLIHLTYGVALPLASPQSFSCPRLGTKLHARACPYHPVQPPLCSIDDSRSDRIHCTFLPPVLAHTIPPLSSPGAASPFSAQLLPQLSPQGGLTALAHGPPSAPILYTPACAAHPLLTSGSSLSDSLLCEPHLTRL